MVTKENATRSLTATLALIGVLLAIADQVKDIPLLAPYSNYSTAFIGVAISIKQIVMIAYEQITGKTWTEPTK